MLKSIIKYRPTNLCSVYVEPLRIEVLQAHRHWRSWEIGVAEQFRVPRGESVFDHLQYLNLKPKGRKGSALLAIVSSAFYSVHSEHYPLSIKDQLDDAVNFDWQENIFQEHDRTLHFSGPPVALNQHVSVPIFSIQRQIYDKLNQALNGTLFHTFAVVPSALSFSALLPLIDGGGEECEIIVRGLDDENLEVHRFYRGAFLDSAVVGKSFHGLKLFGEKLKCTGTVCRVWLQRGTKETTVPRSIKLRIIARNSGVQASRSASDFPVSSSWVNWVVEDIAAFA